MATKSAPKTNTSKKTSSKKDSKKPDRNYSLIRAIQRSKDYKNNVKVRNKHARQYIQEECKPTGPVSVMPGQLLSFAYKNPKTKEELLYYDAAPVTIFFGVCTC